MKDVLKEILTEIGTDVFFIGILSAAIIFGLAWVVVLCLT